MKLQTAARLPACEPHAVRAGMPIPQGGDIPESLLVPWTKTGLRGCVSVLLGVGGTKPQESWDLAYRCHISSLWP